MTSIRSLTILFLLLGTYGCILDSSSPNYPYSQLISGVVFDWKTHVRYAIGSDNWPITWGKDNSQYAAWGDGGGFGGSNFQGRVSLGVASIKGNSESFDGKNIYGGFESSYVSTIDGKSYGIIDLEGILYMWISPGSDNKGYERSTLYSSNDRGGSWQPAPWSLGEINRLIFPTFLQFGKGYEEAQDGYIYIYSVLLKNDKVLSIQKPGEIFLIRTHKQDILKRDAYEFYAGMHDSGLPVWSKTFDKALPIFNDPVNGVGWTVSVAYNSGLQHYFLITEHTKSFAGNIGIYESLSPWGPWFTVYFGQLGEGHIEKSCFYYNFSNKWLSHNGKNFSLIFTGTNTNDSFNKVDGRFLVND